MRLTFSRNGLHVLLPFGWLDLLGGRPRFTAFSGYPAKEAAVSYAAEEAFAFLPDGTDAVKALAALLGDLDDVCVLPDGRLAVARRQGKGAKALALLCVGSLPEEGAEFESAFALTIPAKPTLVCWPEGTIWEGTSPPLSRKKSLVDPGGRMRIGATRDGIAVAQSMTGLVAVVRAGAPEVDFVVRVPAQDEARLAASPTSEGVLVTLVIEGRHSALVHVTAEGQVLGKVEGWGFPPAVRLGQDRVLVTDGEKNEILLCELPTLEVLCRAATSFEVVDLAVAEDGIRFATADATTLQTGSVEEDEITMDPPIELWALANPARAAARAEPRPSPYRPRLAGGPPVVGFPAARTPLPRWDFPSGKGFHLDVDIRSAGGAGRGVRVELSGPALESGLVVAEGATLAGEAASFEPDPRLPAARVARFPGVALPEGLLLPLEPAPKNDLEKMEGEAALDGTHLPLRLELRGAERPGSALLTLAVQPLSATTSPLKWTRPITLK